MFSISILNLSHKWNLETTMKFPFRNHEKTKSNEINGF